MGKPITEGKAPATETTPEETRTPEEGLESLMAEEDAKAEGEEGTKDTEGGETGEKTETTEDPETASVKKLQEFMVKKGFTTVDQVVAFAAEQESKNTTLRQDVQRLSAIQPTTVQKAPSGVVKEEEEKPLALPEHLIDLVTDPAKLQALLAQVEERAEKRAEKRYAKARADESAGALQAQVADKMAKDPEKFNALRPKMIEISLQHPEIKDIDKIFTMAEERTTAERKALAQSVMKEMGLTEVDPAKLKTILTRARVTAPITAGTGSQVDVSKAPHEKEKAELFEAIANADKFER